MVIMDYLLSAMIYSDLEWSNHVCKPLVVPALWMAKVHPCCEGEKGATSLSPAMSPIQPEFSHRSYQFCVTMWKTLVNAYVEGYPTLLKSFKWIIYRYTMLYRYTVILIIGWGTSTICR